MVIAIQQVYKAVILHNAPVYLWPANGECSVHQTLQSLIDAAMQRWRDLIVETDPDVIIGYNICNFDLPYLLRRAETLRIDDFPFWGRLIKT